MDKTHREEWLRKMERQLTHAQQIILIVLVIVLVIVLGIGAIFYYEYKTNALSELMGYCEVKQRYTQGVPQSTYDLYVSVYVLSSPNHRVLLNDDDIGKLFQGANSIWKQHGIEFHILEIKRFDGLDDDRVYVNSDPAIVNQKLNELGNSTAGDNFHDKTLDVFFIDGFQPFKFWIMELFVTEGKGLADGKQSVSAAFVSQWGNLTWNLAHELGHPLGLLDEPESKKAYTLMTNTGCVKTKYYPQVLNQTQINTVLQTAASLNNTQD